MGRKQFQAFSQFNESVVPQLWWDPNVIIKIWIKIWYAIALTNLFFRVKSAENDQY